MKLHDTRRLGFLVSTALSILAPAASTQSQPAAFTSFETLATMESFLSRASVVGDPGPAAGASWRVTLDDGTRKHDAAVETADGSDPTRRNFRFNVAAYELDKTLGLNLVVPSVERQMAGGRAASFTWWLDNFAMNEVERRRKRIQPPDQDSWNDQMQAVRVFDELISNTYRDTSPALYLNSVWDNLLITTDWRIWLTDHTGAFRVRNHLADSESLIRCDRALLRRLRELNRKDLQRVLGKYLSVPQLDALEARRAILVRHYDEQIATRGESAVLYDFPRGAHEAATSLQSTLAHSVQTSYFVRRSSVCRGVLNDITDDAGRDAVFAAFSETLQSNGVLILDVRDWEASSERKTREPLFKKRVSTDQGELTFTSSTALDPENRQLLIAERHEPAGKGREQASDYHFVMRCWERAELDTLLTRHGFGKVSYFGSYDPGIAVGVTDRLVVVAERVDSAA